MIDDMLLLSATVSTTFLGPNGFMCVLNYGNQYLCPLLMLVVLEQYTHGKRNRGSGILNEPMVRILVS